MGKISVLIVDAHPQVRELLARRLGAQPDFTVVAHTGDPTVAADLAWFWEPDIILLDIKRADGGGLDSCRNIARASPASRLVIFTSYLQPDEEELYRKLGACTCLVKSVGLEGLLGELRRCLASQDLRAGGSA